MKVLSIAAALCACSWVGINGICLDGVCEDETSLLQANAILKPGEQAKPAQDSQNQEVQDMKANLVELAEVGGSLAALDEVLSEPSEKEDDETALQVQEEMKLMKQKMAQQDKLLEKVLAKLDSVDVSMQTGKVAPRRMPKMAPAAGADPKNEKEDDRIEGIGGDWKLHSMDPFLANIVGESKVYEAKIKAYELQQKSDGEAKKRDQVNWIEDQTKAEIELIHAGKRAYTTALNAHYAKDYQFSPYHSEDSQWQSVGGQQVGGTGANSEAAAAGAGAAAAPAGGGDAAAAGGDAAAAPEG